MDLEQLIKHPETMDKETLYDLRSLVARYPYYQTARLLMLQNLYILHDAAFDAELRKAAIYITDRKVIFNLVEASHYQLKREAKQQPTAARQPSGSRTISLIDDFLESIPDEGGEKTRKKRRPTPADAAVDYVGYLLDIENEEEEARHDDTPQMKGQDLIDRFIYAENGKMDLKDKPEYIPETDDDGSSPKEDYYTETLARIYIQQGQFERALEIIRQLNLNYPKKNIYFADQIRFLEKLILNSKAG